MSLKKVKKQSVKRREENQIPTYKNISKIIEFCNKNGMSSESYFFSKPKKELRGIPNIIFQNVEYIKSQFQKYKEYYLDESVKRDDRIPKGIGTYNDWVKLDGGTPDPKSDGNKHTNFDMVIKDNTPHNNPKHTMFLDTIGGYCEETFGKENLDISGVKKSICSYRGTLSNNGFGTDQPVSKGSYFFYRMCFQMFVTVKDKFTLEFVPKGKDGVELYKIHVYDKGKGLGTKLMSEILRISNFCGLDLHILPSPFTEDGSPFTDVKEVRQIKKRLKNWYMSFGLKEVDGLQVLYIPSQYEPKFKKTEDGVILKGNKLKKRKRELELV